MPARRERSRSLRRLPYYLTPAIATLAIVAHSDKALATPRPDAARKSTTPKPDRAPITVAEHNSDLLQGDMNTLARSAYRDYVLRLGQWSLSTLHEGRIVQVHLSERAPTSTGSDHGGNYLVDFTAAYSRKSFFDLNKVSEFSIAMGNWNRQNQQSDGFRVMGEMNNLGGSVAELRYPFNSVSPAISEASIRPRNHELRATAALVEDWAERATGMLATGEVQAPTRPLTLDWAENGHQVYPF